MNKFANVAIATTLLISTTSNISSAWADNCAVTHSGLTFSAPTDTGSECIIVVTAGTSGSWTVPEYVSEIRLLAVGGGGAGGSYGGGGAGGFYDSGSFNFSVTSGAAITVTIGAGGRSESNTAVVGTTDDSVTALINQSRGESTIFGTLTVGGGGGGGHNLGLLTANHYKAFPGGSGGVGASGGGASGSTRTLSDSDRGSITGGAADSAAHESIKRFNGGNGSFAGAAYAIRGGGGGGAGGVGGSVETNTAGSGGPGLSSDITGSTRFYAGGGAGGAANGTSPVNGFGGEGGGGNTRTNGAANTGGGGGAARSAGAIYPGSGGSGIVVIRYSHANASVKRMNAETAAQSARKAAEKKTARDALTSGILNSSAINLQTLQQADLGNISIRQSDAVLNEIKALSPDERATIDKIQKIIKKYEIIDRIRDSGPSSTFSGIDLVKLGVVSSENKNRSAIASALRKLPESAKLNLALIQQAVAKEVATINARKARLEKILKRTK